MPSSQRRRHADRRRDHRHRPHALDVMSGLVGARSVRRRGRRSRHQTGMRSSTKNPRRVGADRIISTRSPAQWARPEVSRPRRDRGRFRLATTFDCVTPKGRVPRRRDHARHHDQRRALFLVLRASIASSSRCLEGRRAQPVRSDAIGIVFGTPPSSTASAPASEARLPGRASPSTGGLATLILTGDQGVEAVTPTSTLHRPAPPLPERNEAAPGPAVKVRLLQRAFPPVITCAVAVLVGSRPSPRSRASLDRTISSSSGCRSPRAAIAGAGLAVVGAAFRRSSGTLAEPYVLGVSSSAALGPRRPSPPASGRGRAPAPS
jgi:hypothetical protein